MVELIAFNDKIQVRFLVGEQLFVAQLEEQCTSKAKVVGSTPTKETWILSSARLEQHAYIMEVTGSNPVGSTT